MLRRAMSDIMIPIAVTTDAPDTIDIGARDLVSRDADLARIIDRSGLPRFPRRPPTYGTLLKIILEQQVSLASAAAVWAALARHCGEVTPAAVLTLDDAALRACGFSRQKAQYARDIAAAVESGGFAFDHLATLDDEAAIASLIGLRGVGRWTAEVYLLFALGRPDILPAGDLAVQIALGEVKRLGYRPGDAETRAIGAAWRPWRGVAACLLWQHYLTTPRRRALANAEPTGPAQPLPAA
ncbi:MAG TPA: DNA-3-methyladenine glycosylase 2 family protein [Stellaceae bacterium]|nr:DNA-3-methyladenine glycosylase 2 family protein [Stellaceae bacterium]